MTLDPITRDRLIALLAFQIQDCLDEWRGSPGPTRLAIVMVNCLEEAPELLELRHRLVKQAIKTNALITIAQHQVNHGTYPHQRA
jgi:hypothetical protein